MRVDNTTSIGESNAPTTRGIMIGKSLSRSWPFTLAIAMIGLIASPATANYAALHPDGKTGCDGPVYRADNKTH